MEKIVIDLVAKTDKATSEIEDLKKSIQSLNKEISETSKKSSKELNKVGDEANNSVAGASVQVANLGKAGKTGARGLGYVTTAFRGIGVALKAAGIGLVLTALSAITELMRKNQSVLDAFQTGINLISVSFSAVGDALSNAYTNIVNATNGFDALGKVMSGILTSVINPFKFSFYAIKLGVQEAQLAWEKSFFGGNDAETIKNLTLDILATKDSIVEVAEESLSAGKDIINNFGQAVNEVKIGVGGVVQELGKIEPKKLLETATVMTDLSNNAEVAAVKQAGLVEEYDRLAEMQRQLRDDESASIEDRKKANDELLVILEKQETEMLKAADAQLASAQAQYSINQNQENYIALLEAENNKKAVQAQITGFLSEQKVNGIALLKEEKELVNSMSESESKLAMQKKRFATEQIINDIDRINRLIELNVIEGEIERERLQAIIDNEKAGTQAKIDAKIALDEFTNANYEENVTLRTERANKEIEEEQRIADEKRRINMQYIGFAAGLSGLLQQIAGKNKAIATAGLILEKGAAIANVVIGASQSIASAKFNESKIPFFIPTPTGIPLFNPLKPASLAATAKSIAMTKIGAGLAIAGIGATAIGQASGVSGGNVDTSKPPIPSVPTAPSTPPAFNIVGASGTNQLASAIGGQSQQPIQAFVVSSEVSTAQELDRNIIEDASIGG